MTHSQKIHFKLKCSIPFQGRCCTSINKQTDQMLNTVSTHAGTVSMKRQTPSAGNCPLTKSCSQQEATGLGRGHAVVWEGGTAGHAVVWEGGTAGHAVVWEGGTLWSGKGAQQGTLWSGKGARKLQALVYDILPSTTAVFSYAIGSRKLSANEQFFVGAQTVVNLLQTAQIKQGVSFIAANKVYTSTNKTTIV